MQSCNTCHVAYINPAYKASQERIRAARERLATLELDRSMQIPEVHPPGPPAGAYIIPQYIYLGFGPVLFVVQELHILPVKMGALWLVLIRNR